MTYEIKQLSEKAYDAWDQFVDRSPNATFFHRSGWLKVLQRKFRSPALLSLRRERWSHLRHPSVVPHPESLIWQPTHLDPFLRCRLSDQ